MTIPSFNRRQAVATLGALLAPLSQAQDRYPSHPVKIVSPAPPGGLSDLLPRLFAAELGASMQASFVVENRPGAGGSIGAATVGNAQADGYTLLLATGGMMSFNPYLMDQITYDPRKFVGLGLMGFTPLYLVVRADSPYKTFDDLIAAAKAQKGQLAHGTLGKGSTVAVASALMARAKGVEFIEVPFAGYPPALQELLAGRLAFFMVDGSALARIESGSLRALAVTTPQRASRLPNVPTLKELGVPVELAVWFGLFAPAGVPAPIGQRLAGELRQAMGLPNVRSQLAGFGLEPGQLFGEAFQQWHLAEYKRWGEILPSLGLKPS